MNQQNIVEDTIQNGVKHTHKRLQQFPDNDLEAIQKGVKKTMHLDMDDDYVLVIEDTIQKGVKHTQFGGSAQVKSVEDTIQKGVKETVGSKSTKSISLRHTIQNGVKEIGNKKTPDESFTNYIIEDGLRKSEQMMDMLITSDKIISSITYLRIL